MEGEVAVEPMCPELDEVFHALADPTRRAILARLAHRPGSVSDLAEPFDMSLPAVSKHLKVLERARLISRDVQGRRHLAYLRADTLRDVEEWLIPYREFWVAHFEALARALPPATSPRRRGPRRKAPARAE
jgi:DNA-binding transcriptional ArsR family regulator